MNGLLVIYLTALLCLGIIIGLLISATVILSIVVFAELRRGR